MIRVLVVDDEILVRVGIRSLLPWEQCGLTIVGEASCGEEAIEKLAELEPDVVLTDLAMRRGDGFSVIRAAKASRPGVAVVVLSCHNEFENVREALRLGADDYVFKLTLDPREVLEVFARLAQRFGWPAPRRPEEAPGVTGERSVGPALGAPSIPKAAADRETPVRPLCAGERLAIFELDAGPGQTGTLESLVREALRSRRCAAHVLPGTDRVAVVMTADDRELEELASELRGLASRYVSARLRVAASRTAERTRSGEEAEHEALGALAETFYEPERLGLPAAVEDGGRVELASLVRGEMERLKSALLMLDEPLLLAAWDSTIQILRHARERDIRRVRVTLLDLLSPLRQEAMRRGLPEAMEMSDQDGLLYDTVMRGGTLAEIHSAVAQEIPRCIAALKSGRAVPRAGIRCAVQYVKANLGRPVTLEEGAAAAGMSVSHFAHTFRREMECSFINFVNRAKMERARDLLLTTDQRVYEVAEALGFENPNYFSAVFRKVIGVSPAEIKAKQKS